LSIRLQKYTSGCQSNALIEAVINSAFLSVVVDNSYLDFDDYDTPLKSFLDDRNSYAGISTRKKGPNYMQEKTQLSLQMTWSN